MPTMQVNIEMS